MKTCKKCGVELNDDNWYECFQIRNLGRCKSCHDKLVKDWDSRHPGNAAERESRWRERNPIYRLEYYARNKDAHAERSRLLLYKYKSQVINKLGGKCVNCGIDDIRVLQINHLDGDGGEERLYGMNMYKVILDGSRDTDDLDIRCANCNIIYEYERGKRVMPTGS